MKYLFITAHLSTGGSPKYLEWLIKKIKSENNFVKVIEWNLYSDTYVIQRNSILKMIGAENFLSVGSYQNDTSFFDEKTKDIINYILDYDPDFIHLNEFSENFAIKSLSSELIKFLYNPNRKFKLFETTHSAQSNILQKINIPDELWLVSNYQYNIAKSSNIKSVLVEMDIQKNTRPNREQTLICLGLDPNKIHILQVGLMCKNKNQKFTFDIAKRFSNSDTQFHFIGNACYLDECNIDKNQTNCKIWGERSDVDIFMSCMDVFVMPSFEELNPIALKEALSWDMTCFVSELSTIKDQYKDNKNVIFINKNNFYNFIAGKINSKDNNQLYPILNDSDDININNNTNVSCKFFPTPTVEISGSEKIFYNVKFIDEITNILHHEANISTNMWTACSIEYFCKWKIIVTNLLNNTQQIFKIDLKDKLVKIINESNSLGDTIAWMSAVDEFQKLHNCKVDFFTSKSDLFSSKYPNINFCNYETKIDKNYYTQYKIGCFDKKYQSNLVKTDWRISNLQKISFEILGLSYREIKPKIKIPNKYKLNYKYVCIATQSTTQSRYWNNNGAWEKLVDYIKNKGYKVICVDKFYAFGKNENMNICPKNVDYFAGNHSFSDIIDIINGCEFFIGLSSGLSWLAWTLNKKIIRINGSVNPSFEFYTPYVVQNNSVCNNCFNNLNHKFDPSNWFWCPENKNFECTKYITEKDVIIKIEELLKDSLPIVNKRVKLVHIQTTINTDTEKKSKDFIEKFEQYGIKYINHKNNLYDGDEHLKNCLYPGLLNSDGPDKLTSRHYGCFDSHRKAVLKEFTEDVDFLIVCEGDCLFEKSHAEFVTLLNNITDTCEKNDIGYFSFGDVKTLDNGISQSNVKTVPKNQVDCFITNKIIGTQCIMYSKNIKPKLMDEFLSNKSWYVIDGWLNEFCWNNNINMGILFQRATSQYSGESFINQNYRNFQN